MHHCPHCGCDIGRPPKARSAPMHRRYFGLIRALFMHWPEKHLKTGAAIDFHPESEEHLRKWLQIKAGFRAVTMIEVPSDDPAIIKLALLAAEGVAKAAGDYIFIRPHGHGLAVFTSKSISYHSLGHKEFCELNEAVEAVIAAETGHDPATLLREAERAA